MNPSSKDIELVALTLYRNEFNREPTAPLDKNGGVYDPDGWCITTAKKILAGDTELTGIGSDTTISGQALLAVKEALSNRTSPVQTEEPMS